MDQFWSGFQVEMGHLAGVQVFHVLSNRLIVNYVPRTMDELPIRQPRSQPVNPSHVTINGLAHYCTHNASVDNSI